MLDSVRTTSRSKLIILALLVLAGILIYLPSYNLLPFLVQGDIGRDLYAYQRTMEGGVPYKDYYWNFGPLMPYFYSTFFKLLGVQITSIILGRIILNILSGLIIYCCLALFIEPMIAILGALWFWCFNTDFTYTFNHTGGTLFTLATIYFLFKYIKKLDKKWIYFTIPTLLCLSLIKINIGLSIALASILSVIAINGYLPEFKNKTKTTVSLKIFLIPTFLSVSIYSLLIFKLPQYYIFQCFPFLPAYEPYGKASLIDSTKVLWSDMLLNFNGNASSLNSLSTLPISWPYRTLAFISAFSFVALAYILFLTKNKKKVDKACWTAIATLIIFIIFISHEFLLSATCYRIWWVSPIFILFIFLILGVTAKSLKRLFKIALLAIIVSIIVLEFCGKYIFKEIIRNNPKNFIKINNVEIYTKNPEQWTSVVSNTASYLKANLGKNEVFLAIPYDPLYYYLTDTTSPVPEIIFFDFLNITEDQEKRIISDIERKSVNYVVLSSRIKSAEKGLGFFGKTYGKSLAKYIDKNFEIVKSFGDWSKPAGWIWPHATRIYKRLK